MFPVSSEPVEKGIVTVDSAGTILSVDEWKPGREDYNTEFYNGIIVPGFVNAHCHLELSYLKSQFKDDCGMGGFLQQMRDKRQVNIDRAKEMASLYDAKMFREGISAVADIINTDITADIKKNSPVHYINYVELFGLKSSDADLIRARGEKIATLFQNVQFTPHALYSLSDRLKMHLAEMMKSQTSATLHYFESEGEDAYYRNHSGAFAELLKTIAGELPEYKSEGRWEAMQLLFHKGIRLLLVHNTFAPDTDEAEMMRFYHNFYRVLCPGSNHFISRKKPPYGLFAGHRICLGTDSLASGNDLNMLHEMRCLMQGNDGPSFTEMLKWATWNGAEALGIQNVFGSIEKGKKPGLVLVSNFDYSGRQLTVASTSKRLV